MIAITIVIKLLNYLLGLWWLSLDIGTILAVLYDIISIH